MAMGTIEGTDMAGLLFRKPIEIPHREDALDIPRTIVVPTLRMFDIDDSFTDAVLTLYTRTVNTKYGVSLRGAAQTVACGSGWTLVGNNYQKTLTADTLVYLEYARETAAVTLKSLANPGVTPETAFVSPDDYAYRPLWYIVTAGDPLAIVRASCVDLRASYFVDGIS
jgi:hypothetical protein